MMASRRFGASEESVGAARRFLAASIVDAPTDVRDSVSLMVSELSTNALVHGAEGFDVCVDCSDFTVIVSVSDRGGGGIPVLRGPAPSEPRGRGLRIVDALSDDWGISITPEEGKAVWFRMSFQPSGTERSTRGAPGSSTIDPRNQHDLAPAGDPVIAMTGPAVPNIGMPSPDHPRFDRNSLVRHSMSTRRRHRPRSTQ